MSVKLQLLCFVVSFFYGIFIYLFYKFNLKFIKKANIISKVILHMLITFILVILYINIFYFLNKGIFHIYFIVILLIGFLVSKKKFSK